MSYFRSITRLILQLVAMFCNAKLTPSPPIEALALLPLKVFPLEIILLIAGFLPVEEAACFSLSCRLFYDLFSGPRIIKRFKGNKQLQYRFLNLLERDLPDYIVCYHCKQLHSISKFERYLHFNTQGLSKRKIRRPCMAADREFQPLQHLHKYFCYTVFQMVMKQHRNGGDCSRLLAHMSYKLSVQRYRSVEESDFKVKITHGCLLIRHQRIFKMSAAHLNPIPRLLLLKICPHFNWVSSSSFDLQGRILEHELARWLDNKVYGIECKEVVGSIISCKYCATEFRIDTKNSEKDGRTITITSWKDLGEGRTPTDHKWWSHGEQGSSWAKRTDQLLLLRKVFDRESPVRMFEGDDGSYNN